MSTARIYVCGLAAGMLLCMHMAAGATLPDLYESDVPVPNQSAAARSVALQQILAAVLVKITGERNTAGVPALASLIQNPNQFLQQYRYEQSPNDGNASSAATVTYYDLTRTGAPPIAPTGLVLWAKFDPEVLDHAVRAAHEPLWGQERPATLVWLAIQDESSKNILSAADNNSAIMRAMTGAADQRGVPLIFPRMDMQDRQAVGFPDISADDANRIQQASQVYKPNAILVGSIYLTTPGQYAARWQLTAGAESQVWTMPPDTLTNVAAGGIQTAADHYAQWFAVGADATGMNGVPVIVAGITSVDAYAKVLAYLSGLTSVRAVQVTRAENQTVYFSVDTRGDLDNLQQAALLGGLLKPMMPADSTTPAPPVTTAALRFQYVP